MTDNRAYHDEEALGEVKDLKSLPGRTGEKQTAVETADDVKDCGPYAGMPKEVLLQYSRQRKYVWARNILTAIVFLTTLILLALVIAVIAISPPCLQFWQTSPIYRIYPKSFRSTDDSNGYGDLGGVVDKLDYLNDDLGVKVISLGSVYQSPRIDQSDYDISDFRQIDSVYGEMEDMENLITEVHDRGMQIVLDFVPNHSSDQHKWFLASSNTSHPEFDTYKDYYVWATGSDDSDVPNNWRTDLGDGSAWTWNDDRLEFYYHSSSPNQPDLNLRNPKVREELKDILRFWLEKGVDGFRAVGTTFLLEAAHMRDNPVVNSSVVASVRNLHPDYTQNYKGAHDLVAEWREILEDYSTEPGVYRFMETDSRGDLETALRYYGTDSVKEADFPINDQLTTIESDQWNADNIAQKILQWMRGTTNGRWPNWGLSNGFNARIASRVPDSVALSAAVMAMTLPGTPSIYYGDEIGMKDDLVSSPMQWSVESNAGFCGNCTPWTPPNENYISGITVQNQTADGKSFLTVYKDLVSLRGRILFQRGYLCVLGNVDGALGFVRELEGLGAAIVLANFEDRIATPNLSAAYSTVPLSGTVEIFTGSDESLKKGKEIQFDSIQLPPMTAAVITYSSPELVHKNPSMEDNCFVHLKLCYNSALQVVQYC